MYCFDEWFAVKHNEDFLCQKSDQVRNSVQPASVVLVDFTNACRLNAVGFAWQFFRNVFYGLNFFGFIFSLNRSCAGIRSR